MNPDFEYISIREFSRRVGVSDTAIHKAIKEGRISKGYDKIRGRKAIEYETVLKVWEKIRDPLKTDKPPQIPKKPKRRKADSAEADSVGDASVQVAEVLEIDFDGDTDEAAFSASRAKKIKFEAKIKELEYKQKTGELVAKDEVYRELFSKGKAVREAILSVPDRIIDDLMASRSRAEAHSVLLKELNRSLEGLTEIEKG